jgi:aminoglycoside phosphotransferase (APT) family kinase protein
MTHGDLMPGNLLVSRGRLAGVLDTGSLAPADPALDLVGAWHLLEWERGKAWAFEQAMGLVAYYAATNPTMSRIGRRTLDRILADEPPA